MRQAITILFDESGKASMKYGPEVPVSRQRTEYLAMKHNGFPPGCTRAELWHSDSGRDVPAINTFVKPTKIHFAKTMKKLIPLIILGFILSVATAVAQQQTLLTSYATYQAVDSNCLPRGLFIDCRGQQNVAIGVETQHSGTATAAEGICFYPSMDGRTNWSTECFNLICAPASTAKTRQITNMNVKGYPYLMLAYITNIDADTYSTNTVKWWLKKDAP